MQKKRNKENTPTASLPLKITHVFLKRENSLRSNSPRFLTENFPDFINASELRSGLWLRCVFIYAMFFDCFDQFLEVIEGEVFFFDEGGDGTEIGVVEVLADDALQSALAELLTTHYGIILIGGTIGTVRHIAFVLQSSHYGREGVEMGLGVIVELKHVFHEHGTMLPKMVHGLFFFVG